MEIKMKTRIVKENVISKWLVLLFASACGIIVANLYYAQPLIGLISKDIGMPLESAGIIVTMTQLGYAFGLLFFVPLSDLLENKKLIIGILLIAIAGLIVAIFSNSTSLFLIAAIMIGLGSVSAQILVPLASFLVPDDQRGKMIGNVMSGLLLGIMLARPISSFLAGVMNWKFVFVLSAILMLFLIVILQRQLPSRRPIHNEKYVSIIKSLGKLMIKEEVLRRRAFYQATLFGAFSLFWTVTPQWLSSNFHLTQQEIALFAFLGVAGAVAAPIAGRLADKGWIKKLTLIAFVIAIISFLIPHFFDTDKLVSLILLGLSAVILDCSVSGNLVLGQQKIYALGSEKRGRMNGVFMALFFIGGAIGSSIGGYTYVHYGWSGVTLLGALFPCLGLIYFLTERKE
jgi:predicted MFS family arabinose efflux permease